MSRSSLLWCFENPILTYRLTVHRSGQSLHWTCLLCNEQHVWKSGIHKRSKDSFPASAVSRRQKGGVWSRNLTWVWHGWNWEGCDLVSSSVCTLQSQTLSIIHLAVFYIDVYSWIKQWRQALIKLPGSLSFLHLKNPFDFYVSRVHFPLYNKSTRPTVYLKQWPWWPFMKGSRCATGLSAV